MSDDNNRYSQSRNLWRKVYPKVGSKPRIIQTVVGLTTNSINLQNYQRDRNPYRIYPDTRAFAPVIPEPETRVWQDDKVVLGPADNDDLEYTINFSYSFPGVPNVAFAVIAEENPWTLFSDQIVDILPFIIDEPPIFGPGYATEATKPVIYGVGEPTATSVTFRLSTPYTGSIHYFGIYNSPSSDVEITSLLKSPYWDLAEDDVMMGAGASIQINNSTQSLLTWPNVGNDTKGSFLRYVATPYVIRTQDTGSIMLGRKPVTTNPVFTSNNYEIDQPHTVYSVTASFSTTVTTTVKVVAFGLQLEGG